jgi:TonB family protein
MRVVNRIAGTLAVFLIANTALNLRIETDGHVSKVEVIESTGHALLDEISIKVVKTRRGDPAVRGPRGCRTFVLPIKCQLQ